MTPHDFTKRTDMIEESHSSTALTYEDASAILGEIGVFTLDFLFRDGHASAFFAASSVDVTGSIFSQREVSEKDWMRLLGHLLAEAAERGLLADPDNSTSQSLEFLHVGP